MVLSVNIKQGDGSPATVATTDALLAAVNAPGSDNSQTITTGGSSQPLFPSVPTNGFGVYNDDPSTDLWLSISQTAASIDAAGSIRIEANGGSYETPPNFKPTVIPAVISTLTGHKITVIQW